MSIFTIPTPILDPTSPIFIAIPFVLYVFKWLFLILFALYVIFALVVVRQVSLMARTVSTLLEPLIKILAIIHLIAAVLLWILAFIA